MSRLIAKFTNPTRTCKLLSKYVQGFNTRSSTWPRHGSSSTSNLMTPDGASASTYKYVPRRAVLYVPGNDERKIRKVTNLDVDCAVLDCEDGVALNRKEDARHNICKMLNEVDFGRTEPVVRINSVPSGLAEEDLKVTLNTRKLPPTIMLPKVEDISHIEWFSDKLQSVMTDKGLPHQFNLVIFVETAIGLLNLRAICERAVTLSKSSSFHLDGIVFGSDDFCADIGATRTRDASELIYARQKVVTTAKAFRLQAIDLVHIDYKDVLHLRVQSDEGARMGFTGKQVIHPAQIPVVQEAFTPSEDKIEWATELIKAFEHHQESGKGAFTFRGNMIDMPLLLQAKNIVHLVQGIQRSQT